MPVYDYIYGTVDKTSDALYETSLKRQEDSPDVVHLTHLTTPESIYHMRLGFASMASKPHDHHTSSKWYMWLMWPVTVWSMMFTWIYGRTFVVERNHLNKFKLQTWAIPRYNFQVCTYEKFSYLAGARIISYVLIYLINVIHNFLVTYICSICCCGKMNRSIG